MKKRQRKKFASIDASGVKEIAEMQWKIDKLEDAIKRLHFCILGLDDMNSYVLTGDSIVDFDLKKIYDFIKEHKGNIEEIESLLTQSDDVDDIVYSYHQIEGKIKELEKKEEQ